MELKFINPKTVQVSTKISVDKIKVVVDLFNKEITSNPDRGIWSINSSICQFKLLNDTEFSDCCNLAEQNNMKLSQEPDNYQSTMYILKVVE